MSGVSGVSWHVMESHLSWSKKADGAAVQGRLHVARLAVEVTWITGKIYIYIYFFLFFPSFALGDSYSSKSKVSHGKINF